MSNTITIPAGALADVRDGLALEIGEAIDELNRLLNQPDREYHDDWFEEIRQRLEAAFALVDQVGWAPDENEHEITIDLASHGALLKRAIEARMPELRELLEEIDLSDAWRARENMPPRKQQLQARQSTIEQFLATLEQALQKAGL